MGVAFLVLLAIGALMVPEYRANPITWLISGAIILGAIGILYGKWRDFEAREATIQTERNTRR